MFTKNEKQQQQQKIKTIKKDNKTKQNNILTSRICRDKPSNKEKIK